MSDPLQRVLAGLGRQVGLPTATALRRSRRLPSGPIALAVVTTDQPPAKRSAAEQTGLAAATLNLLGISVVDPVLDLPELRDADDEGRPRPPAYRGPLGAIVVDATQVQSVAQLEQVRAALRPALAALEPSGRVVLLGQAQDSIEAVEPAAVQQALEGIVRSVGKEARSGASANLIRVNSQTSAAGETTASDLASTLSFLLEGRSAYVSGQPITVGHAEPELDLTQFLERPDRPFADRVVVVTGAARGIGAAIAKVFSRDGARVVVADLPSAGQALADVANNISASALHLDVTAADAGAKIAEFVTERFGPSKIHALIHNAGITRDKLMVNTDEQRWDSVLQVNLVAQLRINETLLDDDLPGGLATYGRIVTVASTSGIAGNRGQANYAASKAGLIGLVRATAAAVPSTITVNGVAPGFIDTEMTSAMPLVAREIGRRINSLQQAGQPVDVAETIAWLAQPASAAVTGQVVRVCGQSQLGA